LKANVPAQVQDDTGYASVNERLEVAHTEYVNDFSDDAAYVNSKT